jgi:hypothetical protein
LAFNEQGITDKYTAVVNKHLGKGKLVRDCDDSQIDLLSLILDDLHDVITQEGIIIEK